MHVPIALVSRSGAARDGRGALLTMSSFIAINFQTCNVYSRKYGRLVTCLTPVQSSPVDLDTVDLPALIPALNAVVTSVHGRARHVKREYIERIDARDRATLRAVDQAQQAL